jgi:hypothetical protein
MPERSGEFGRVVECCRGLAMPGVGAYYGWWWHLRVGLFVVSRSPEGSSMLCPDCLDWLSHEHRRAERHDCLGAGHRHDTEGLAGVPMIDYLLTFELSFALWGMIYCLAHMI